MQESQDSHLIFGKVLDQNSELDQFDVSMDKDIKDPIGKEQSTFKINRGNIDPILAII